MGSLEVVKLLIEYGADPLAEQGEKTPVEFALEMEQPEIHAYLQCKNSTECIKQECSTWHSPIISHYFVPVNLIWEGVKVQNVTSISDFSIVCACSGLIVFTGCIHYFHFSAVIEERRAQQSKLLASTSSQPVVSKAPMKKVEEKV